MLETPCQALSVQPVHLHALIAEARRCFPHECCGILVGRMQSQCTLEIVRVVPAKNVAASRPDERYEIDPRALLHVESELRNTTDEFVAGYFHSHPRGANAPSSIDLNDARGVFDFARRFFVYAIVSLQGDGGVRWWNLAPTLDRFVQVLSG